jgi:hypothetical protein
MRIWASTAGRLHAASTVKVPGLTVTWKVSQRAGHLPRLSVSTTTSSRLKGK